MSKLHIVMFLSKDFVFQVVQIEYISPKNEFVLLTVVAELGLYRYSFWDNQLSSEMDVSNILLI